MRADGTVAAWGNNEYGQTNVPVGLSNCVAIAAGGYHNLALNEDGTIASWGCNGYGLGEMPAGLSNVTAIAAGTYHSLAITREGSLVGWGAGDQQPNTTPYFGQAKVPMDLTNVIAAAGGYGHSLAIGILPPYVHTLRAMAITQTRATLNGMLLANERPAVAWFEWGPLGGYTDSTPAFSVGPGKAVVHANTVISNLLPHQAYQFRLVVSNEVRRAVGPLRVFCTGNPAAMWGARPGVPASLTNIVCVSSGEDHSLALKNDGRAAAWGDSSIYYGQLVVPGTLTNAIAIAAGGWHNLALLPDRTIALRADGTIVVWGAVTAADNAAAATLTNVIDVVCGAWNGMALMADGTVVAWGDNTDGQSDVPLGLTNATMLSLEPHRSLAIADNVPPQTRDLALAGDYNREQCFCLPHFDPNHFQADPAVKARILSLPANGILYQQSEQGGRGVPILTAPAWVTSAEGIVYFVPALYGFGTPYASFSFDANDGVLDSAPATVTVNIAQPSAPTLRQGAWTTNGAFELPFWGQQDAQYQVWCSSNLLDWILLGTSTEESPGWFKFIDVAATNSPRRFYRAGIPPTP